MLENRRSSPSRLIHTTEDCGAPSGLIVETTAKVCASSSRLAVSGSLMIVILPREAPASAIKYLNGRYDDGPGRRAVDRHGRELGEGAGVDGYLARLGDCYFGSRRLHEYPLLIEDPKSWTRPHGPIDVRRDDAETDIR